MHHAPSAEATGTSGFDTYWKLIYSVAIKLGLNDAEAQEVVQETIISVSRNIGSFRYNPKACSLKRG